MEKTLFSTPELAEWLGVFHTTVRRWIEGGRIKGIRVGRNYKIPADEVIRILDGHGIPLPEIVKKYKLKKQQLTAQYAQQDNDQGSFLRKLLVVEDISEPAFICRKSAIMGANVAFAKLVGYAQEELIGLSITEVLNEDGTEGICMYAKNRVESPYGSPEEYVTRLKNNGNSEVRIVADALDGMKDIYLLVVKAYGEK
jgi:excisionase family DNA binding protein/PAS domain S-box-containing protein